ncbi:SDR family NAD(P)-dependent oxidoreductase [Pseudonocardia bannensis]|uniref:SDR family NAD(P)-dependent oxidoreductase n=1 Tax=Pseudonocardia bannensis TaxID=630973 RepID=UPI0028AEFE99|nr:SDR family oxidoreductase [Pseudonocardia bannensis]
MAFISGGGSGIGRASALAFARLGHAVMIGDADAAAAAATAKEITEAGGSAAGVQVDVSDEGQVRDAVDATVSEFGRLDSAVNSAGIQGELGPAGECSTPNWELTLAVNLTGTFLCMREQIRVMLPQGAGSIVNISSNFGLVGKKGIPAYCASKHGVIGLTKSAALDYAAHGIRINTVCPGPTTTPMFDKIVEESGDRARTMLQEVESSVPMGRLGMADDIAAAVTWLCSDAASFVTGTAMPVDGGFVVG